MYICSDLIKVRSSGRPSTGCRRVAPPPGRLERSIDPVIKIATYKKPLIVPPTFVHRERTGGGKFHLPAWDGMGEKRRATSGTAVEWIQCRFAFPPGGIIRFSSDNDNTSIQTARCICAFDLSIRKAYFSHYINNRENITEWRVIPSHASAACDSSARIIALSRFRYGFVLLLFVYHETPKRRNIADASGHRFRSSVFKVFALFGERATRVWRGSSGYGALPRQTFILRDQRVRVRMCTRARSGGYNRR